MTGSVGRQGINNRRSCAIFRPQQRTCHTSISDVFKDVFKVDHQGHPKNRFHSDTLQWKIFSVRYV